ncbi:MAG: hypothetical protein JXR49_02550 [Acidobacteria bacterium]|nr:hypothetical protein [Acidobacteriota bacterium]
MGYSTGSATSQIDLVQQLAAWLVTQGWTLDDSMADGSGWRCHLHKGSWYVHFRTRPTGCPWISYYYNDCLIPCLFMYLSTAYAGSGQPWYASTTGAPLGTDNEAVGTGIVVNTGTNHAYYFFHDGNDHYTIVVERNAGLFMVMGFGLDIIKHGGNWTGGQYLYGQVMGGNTYNTPQNDNMRCPFHYGTNEYASTINGSYIRADVDSFTDKWIGIGPETSVAREGWTGRKGYGTVDGDHSIPNTIPHTKSIKDYLVSSVNNQAVLLPIRLYVERDAGGPCLLATAPDVWQSNAVEKGYLTGDEIQLGADTYMIFPTFAVKKVA